MKDLDPWEYQYISQLKDNDVLAWEDEEAFYRYPKYSHVYDKYFIGKTYSGLKTWDLEKETPTEFPVVIKPKTNLFGLGKDCYIANSAEEIEHVVGMIAQEFTDGLHYSTDYVLKDGKIIDSFTFTGYKNFYNDFTLWESYAFPDRISMRVESILDGYTGLANFESVEGRIIEGHLRGSLQFYDISGGLLQQMPKFIKTGQYDKVTYEHTFSKVCRTYRKGHMSVKSIPKKDSSIRSVQLCYEPNKSLVETNPGGHRKRWAVINGTDLTKIDNYGKMLRQGVVIDE